LAIALPPTLTTTIKISFQDDVFHKPKHFRSRLSGSYCSSSQVRRRQSANSQRKENSTRKRRKRKQTARQLLWRNDDTYMQLVPRVQWRKKGLQYYNSTTSHSIFITPFLSVGIHTASWPFKWRTSTL
jgi:hypothetical protein